jgi:hypothetical protein
MKIVIQVSAQEDLADGSAFYQNQKDGLGNYFLETLLSDIDSLKVNAGIHRRVFGFNRLLSEKFPYAIYYAVESETVYVRAVLDCRRAPVKLKSRLRWVFGPPFPFPPLNLFHTMKPSENLSECSENRGDQEKQRFIASLKQQYFSFLLSTFCFALVGVASVFAGPPANSQGRQHA